MESVPPVGSVWTSLRPHLAPYRGIIALTTCFALVSAVAEGMSLVILVALGESLLSSNDRDLSGIVLLGRSLAVPTRTLLIVGLGSVASRTVLQLLSARLTARLSSRYEADRKKELLNSYLAANWAIQSVERSGHFQTVFIADVDVCRATIDALAKALIAFFGFAVLLASALLLDPPVAGGVILSIAVVGLALRPLSHRARRYAYKRTSLNSALANHVGELLIMAKEFRVFHVQDAVGARLGNLVDEIRSTRERTEFLGNAISAISQGAVLLFAMTGMVVIYVFKPANLASVGAVVLLLIRALTYSTSGQAIYHALVERLPHFDRVQGMSRHYSGAAAEAGGIVMTGVEELSFASVCFEYVQGTTVLTEVNFSTKRGEIIGIVGASGSGKSTLVQLLLRLRQPTRGQVLANGEDISKFSSASWYARVGYVSQDPLLIDATVAENIRFFRDNLDDADIVQAAGRAGLVLDLHKNSLGHDTATGERGDALSGGQRQRVCIARALAGKPDLLIFDEPTSALDARSEQSVRTTLASLRGELTIFIVAHRITTLSICDRIMVLDDGRLTFFATPDVLATESEYYRDSLRMAGLT